MDMYMKIKIADSVESEYRVVTNYKDIYDLALLVPKSIHECELKEDSVINFLYHDWKIINANYDSPCIQYIAKIIK